MGAAHRGGALLGREAVDSTDRPAAAPSASPRPAPGGEPPRSPTAVGAAPYRFTSDMAIDLCDT